MTKIVRGPIAKLVSGDMVYQVTLASGMIVTNPETFGNGEDQVPYSAVIISEDGRVLVSPKPKNPEVDQKPTN